MTQTSALYAPMFLGDAAALFAPERVLGRMLKFELALALALEQAGVAPAGTGQRTADACALSEDGQAGAWLDAEALAREAVGSGNLAIPFVKRLTAQVASRSSDAAAWVHFGATSQDVLDTALVLGLRELAGGLDVALLRIVGALRQLATSHRSTVMAGRTWLQQGPPVTLGLKAAGWLAATLRHRERIEAAGERALVLQFGGAVGTLASLGDRGDAVAQALASRLGLGCPALPWHSERDSLGELAACFGLLCGSFGKIARDVSLLMQTEVAEVLEGAAEGKGGSSTMPHKRNPVGCAYVLAAATRAPGLVATMFATMVQEHERGLGGWHAEWPTMPELAMLTLGAAAHTAELLEELEVRPERMLANLEATKGYAMGESVVARLAPSMGRMRAHHLVERLTRAAVAADGPLLEFLLRDPEVSAALTPEQVRAALEPGGYLGMTEVFIDRVLASVPERRDA